MRYRLFLLILILTFNLEVVSAQVGINLTGDPPHPSAMLDVESTTGGLLLPRMTSVQRDEIVSPVPGLQIYTVDLHCVQVYMPYSGWMNIVCDIPPSSAGLVCQQGWTIAAGATIGDIGCVTFMYRGMQVTYTTVRAADEREWLRQNLGSTRVAEDSEDVLSFGDLFQWGRWDDGHQDRNSPGSGEGPRRPADIVPGPDNTFYHNSSSSLRWWGNGVVGDTWQGIQISDASTTNGVDPCRLALGSGWHVPSGHTGSEWAEVFAAEGITGVANAFSSRLRLPASQLRSGSSGSVVSPGEGKFWSATSSTGIGAYRIDTGDGTTSVSFNSARSAGAAIRCVR